MIDITTKGFEATIKGMHLNQELYSRLFSLEEEVLNKHNFYQASPRNEGLCFSFMSVLNPVIILHYGHEQHGATMIIRQSGNPPTVSYTGRSELADAVISGIEDLSEIHGERINLEEIKLKCQTH